MSEILERLREFDEEYEQASAEGARVDLPPGKYDMRVAGSEVFESKDGRLYLRLELTVAEGYMTGATISKLYNLDNPERLPWLKKDMFNMGIMVQKLSEIPAQLEKIRDILLSVEVKQNGKYTNYYINGRAIPKAAAGDATVPF